MARFMIIAIAWLLVLATLVITAALDLADNRRARFAALTTSASLVFTAGMVALDQLGRT